MPVSLIYTTHLLLTIPNQTTPDSTKNHNTALSLTTTFTKNVKILFSSGVATSHMTLCRKSYYNKSCSQRRSWGCLNHISISISIIPVSRFPADFFWSYVYESKVNTHTHTHTRQNQQRPRRKNKVYVVFNLNRNSDKYCVQIILLHREQESLKTLVKLFKINNLSRIHVKYQYQKITMKKHLNIYMG